MKRFAGLAIQFGYLGCSLLFAGTPRVESARFAAVHEHLQSFVDDSTIAGAVTLVASRGQILSLDALGYSDLATRKVMRADDLFWIASMTKPMTAVAVLILQEEGKLAIEDPVEKYLAEFTGRWLVAEQGTNQMKLIRPERPITIRDLLTHTSGIGDPSAPTLTRALPNL